MNLLVENPKGVSGIVAEGRDWKEDAKKTMEYGDFCAIIKITGRSLPEASPDDPLLEGAVSVKNEAAGPVNKL